MPILADRTAAISGGPFTFHNLPADASNITQRFGENPEYYQKFGLPYHLGVDFGLWENDPVYTVAPGTAVLTNRDPDHTSGFGIHATIRHGPREGGEHYTTTYAHLNYLTIQAGQIIPGGAHIGGAGSTGRITGPHLHFQLDKDGRPIDPMPYLEPLLGEEQPISPIGYTFGFVFAPSTIPSEGYAGQFGLNLRHQPSATAVLMGYLPPGTRFQIIAKPSGGYYPIYVAQQFIEERSS